MLLHIQNRNFGTHGTFGYQFHEEKYNFNLHIHQFAELTYMLDGEMDITVGNRTETLKSGQLALIFPFHTHSYSSTRLNRFAIFTFSPSIVSDFMKNTNGKIGEKTVFTPSNSTSVMFDERILKEQQLSLYSIRACLYAALSDFSAQIRLISSSGDNNMLSKLLSFMNQHYSEPITLTETAKSVGYSANYLSHCIKKSFALNYSSLLSCIRTENAKSLLAESDISILNVALECGFGSERSFHRQFKNITGQTPGQYRNENKIKILNRNKCN